MFAKFSVIKRALKCHLLRKRSGCYHKTRKPNVRHMILNLSQIHASVIYQIP